MKTTKRTLMAALALAGALSWQPQALATDQDKPAADQRLAQLRDRMQEMAKDLDLTEAQKEKLKPIWQEQTQKMRELVRDQNLSRQEKMEQFRKLRENLQPKLKEIFTAEQMEKWQKQGGAQAGGSLRDSLADLKLTDEQKEKLKPVFQAQMAKVRELRQDSNLSAQEKAKKLKALRQEAEPELKKVLTAEQFEQWKKLAEQRLARVQTK